MSSVLEVHLWDATNTTHLAVLEKAFAVKYADVLSGLGSGEFTIAKPTPFPQATDTTDLALLVATGDSLSISVSDLLLGSSPGTEINKTSYIVGGTIVRLVLNNTTIGAFIVERLETPDLLTNRNMRVSGRTLLGLFDRAIVHPLDTNDYSTMEQTYVPATFATLIRYLSSEASTRGVSVPTNDFTGTNDSDGTAFTDWNVIKYRCGTSLMDVILQHAGLGIEVTVGPTGVLHYYVSGGAGQDRSDTVFFREGQNILSAGRTEDHKDLYNYLLCDGQNVLNASQAPSSIATYGRRERLAQLGNVADTTTLVALSTQAVLEVMNPKHSINLTVEPNTLMADSYGVTAALYPFIDYFLGDTVTVDIPSESLYEEYRIRGIALASDGDNLTVQLSLNSLIDDYLLQLEQGLRRRLLTTITGVISGVTSV